MVRTLRIQLPLWWQYAVAILFATIFGYPLIWMIYSSFKSTRELLHNVWALPTHISFETYQEVLSSSSFLLYYKNTIILSLVCVPLLTLLAAMTAFAFSRVKFPGRTALFYFFLAGTMIPIHATLIPLYALMRDIGWVNELKAIVLPFVGFGLPVSVYILRGFFDQIPWELEEAARIDGCSTRRIFWSIMLPLSKPALTTVAILNLVNIWNQYIFALTLVGANNKAYTLPIGIVGFVSELGRVQYDKMLTGLTLASLPVLVFYFLAQRQIIKSITAGALKG